MNRNVRGVLFVDYVKMVRGNKSGTFSKYLEPEDQTHISARIDPEGWYPMATFERLGLGILYEVAREQLAGVEMWGRFQVSSVRAHSPNLVVDGDPAQTMMRFRVLARSFFDYDAIEVVSIEEEEALVSILFGMGDVAERTASHQTLGFFLGLLEAAGARDAHAVFRAKAWEGASRSVLELHWTKDEQERPSRPSRG